VDQGAIRHAVATTGCRPQRIIGESSMQGIHDYDKNKGGKRVALPHGSADRKGFRQAVLAPDTTGGTIQGGNDIVSKG